MFKRLINRLFLSCLKATELLEKRLHFSLNRKERYQLKMHKMICQACARYEKQSLLLDKSIKIQKISDAGAKDIERLKSLIMENLD